MESHELSYFLETHHQEPKTQFQEGGKALMKTSCIAFNFSFNETSVNIYI